MSEAANYEGYGWIRVPRYRDDPSLSWEERYRRLENHHVEETTFLIDEIRKLASQSDSPDEVIDISKSTGDNMQLEDYLDFDEIDTEPFGKVEIIRVKGTRIGIEFIIQPYLEGDSPERIYQGYRHSLSLEQVYATITYYLHNREKIDDYLKKGLEIQNHYYQEYLSRGPSAVEQKLRNLKAAKTP